MNIRHFLFCILISVLTNVTLFAQQSPVELIAMDTVGILGKEFNVDIKVNSFTNIIAMQASINWNPDILAYQGVSNFGLPYFDADDFGITAADQGHVRFLWEPDDATAVSLEDSSLLFSVTFEVLSDELASTEIGFSDNVSDPPFQIEIANANYDILSVNTFEGTIEILSEEIITGLERSLPELGIYPNPFSELVQIHNPDGVLDHIMIYDAKGTLIEQFFNLKEKFINLRLTGSYDGIYLVRIKKGEKFISRKIVKK